MENRFKLLDLMALLNLETKDNLWKLWLEPLIHFANDHPNTTWGTLTGHEILNFVSHKKNPSKNDFINLCAKVYSNQPFVMSYYNSLPPISKDIIFCATWNNRISQDQLEKLMGGPVWFVSMMNAKYDLSLYYGQIKITIHQALRPWVNFLTHSPDYVPFRSGSGQPFEKIIKLAIQFPLLMRKVFAAAIPKPEGYYLEEISQLPKGIISFSFEKQIFQELPLFLAYYSQGILNFTQKGAPNPASVKKMDRVLKLEPFPLEENFYLRSSLIAGLFSDTFGIPSANEDLLSILKRLFEPLRSKNEWRAYPSFLLSYLKGIRSLDAYYFDTDVTVDIFSLVKKFPVDKWMSRGNLTTYLRAHFINLKFLETSHLERLSSDFSRIHLGYNSTEKEIWDHIHFPNFLGHLYLLAAFGLLEIAEDPDWFMENSYYDHFVACKLTNLGAFVFGQIHEYEVPENAGGVKIIPAQDTLTVSVEGNTAVAEVLLKDYLQKVSENKFKLSSDGFLKDCTNEKSLKNKINLFRRVINKPLPSYWESYFEELIKNSGLIKSSPEFFVFKLPEGDKQLLNILVKDPDLKKIVIKAEHYHVLLKKSDKAAFISKLKAYGYLANIS